MNDTGRETGKKISSSRRECPSAGHPKSLSIHRGDFDSLKEAYARDLTFLGRPDVWRQLLRRVFYGIENVHEGAALALIKVINNEARTVPNSFDTLMSVGAVRATQSNIRFVARTVLKDILPARQGFAL